jgi:dihydrofolate reductase
MKLIAIAAVALDGTIGIGDNIPWRISEDFKHFRNTTMGHTLIMGYNTFKTLPKKALEGRVYVVLSKKHTKDDLFLTENENVIFVDSVELAVMTAKAINKGKVFVAGGAIIYDLLLEYCDEAIITWVNKTYPEGDKIFPMEKLFNGFTFVNECDWIVSKEEILYKMTYYKNIIK